MTAAGSPGVRWMSKKTATVTRKAVGTISPNRLAMYSTTRGVPLALPHLRQPVDPVRDQREVLYVLSGDLRDVGMMREHIHRAAGDDPLRLLVELLALCLVRGRAGLLQELVDLGVRVPAVVEAATRMPEGIHVAVGIDAAGPARQRRLELVLNPRLERELGELLRLQGDGDAGLRELRLDELAFLDVVLDIAGLESE